MLYSIQLLRGIAALLVVMSHVSYKAKQYNINVLNWFNVGSSGVDLFFIISGFIMCYTTHNRDISFNRFIKNRFNRIIPLYWFLTFIALAVFLIKPSLINSSGGTTGIIDSFFLLPSGHKYLIQNGWTLSYEFYFYLIFAIAIFIFSNRQKRYFAIIATLTCLPLIGLLINTGNSYLAFMVSGYLLEFALGIFAFLIFKNFNFGKVLSILALVLGLTLLIYQNFNTASDFVFSRVVNFGIPMFLIFIGTISIEDVFSESKNIIHGFFEKLGDSSYSLYLAHPFALSPIAMICKYLGIIQPSLFLLLLTSSAILSGFFVYYFIEKPLAKLIKKRDQRGGSTCLNNP